MTSRNVLEADLARGEHAARKALSELGVPHPAGYDLPDLLWVLRRIVVRDTALSGCVGRTTRVAGSAIISVSSSVDYEPRRRFIIAHEFGHYEIHGASHNQIELCDSKQVSDESQLREIYAPSTEREANAFASEFLMPRAVWEKRCTVRKPSLEIIKSLQNEFDVSFIAAGIRFAKLTPERCAVVLSQDGKVSWAASGKDFGYYIQRGSRLSKYTIASDYFSGRRPSDVAEPVPATAWLDKFRLSSDYDLIEHCQVIPALRATLSLLWIPPDAEY
ncbi:ImmA/IrrE family metallo-endopeptidase [Corallococcus aberystwythensis]|uniref:ImmA/IrrE family metallo-endopeptidase n=1 Tax=Corallococcus aberystwythensis TaxID=2316722 RepID=A0A3A8QKZ5_9BACT|nr:ImmA/IrrE family metallo-endopeptidase [Corallococcus aberystwythensis]RKH68488.1 ImmA/IrrE family metallo-endopeptidase [Corallococcus aberystwythensis]